MFGIIDESYFTVSGWSARPRHVDDTAPTFAEALKLAGELIEEFDSLDSVSICTVKFTEDGDAVEGTHLATVSLDVEFLSDHTEAA